MKTFMKKYKMTLIRRHRPEALTNDGGVFISLECFTFIKKYKCH